LGKSNSLVGESTTSKPHSYLLGWIGIAITVFFMLRALVLYVADVSRAAATEIQVQFVSGVDGTLLYSTLLSGLLTILLAYAGNRLVLKRRRVLPAVMYAIASIFSVVAILAPIPLLLASILAIVDMRSGGEKATMG